MYNPWMVPSLNEFTFLCCPECVFRSKIATSFQTHAIQNHQSFFNVTVSSYYPAWQGVNRRQLPAHLTQQAVATGGCCSRFLQSISHHSRAGSAENTNSKLVLETANNPWLVQPVGRLQPPTYEIAVTKHPEDDLFFWPQGRRGLPPVWIVEFHKE